VDGEPRSQFVVVWSSYEQDDSESSGVFGQRFDFEVAAAPAEIPRR
jgi:hypothetical protein